MDFARAHDDDMWQCTCDILYVDPAQARSVKDVASLPLVLGGLGLRSAERVCVSALTIHARHPVVADVLVRQLEGHPHTPCLRATSEAAFSLHGILGWSPPSWTAVRDGTRLETRQPEENEPGSIRGWQHEAASRVDQRFRNEDLFARLTYSGQALVRSQGGLGAGLALSSCPTCRITRIDPQSWEGGGALWRRLLARICREAGGRWPVPTNVMVRDLDLAEPNVADTRRLEVVADGLPLFGGAQLAIDTTIVSTLHANGAARRFHEDGAALEAARRVKGRRSLGGVGRGGLWPLVLGDQVLLELPGQGQGAFRVAFDVETRRAGLATSLGFPVFLHSSTVRGNVFA